MDCRVKPGNDECELSRLDIVAQRFLLFLVFPPRDFTTSPIEISPITLSFSTTGKWRNFPAVIFSMIAPTVSALLQVTTLRVMTALTGSSSTLAPRSPKTRTMSRSDRMPSRRPSLITSTAPMRRSPSSLIAADSFASGLTEMICCPFEPRIACTVMIALAMLRCENFLRESARE